MQLTRVTLLLTCGVLALLPALSPGADLKDLAQQATRGDQAAIKALREAGAPGLDALFAANQPLIDQMRSNQANMDSTEVTALRQALDTVAAQRDAYASGLYWYTDLKAAQAEAQRSGKLILSLRMLGKLSDEYSCANSRFFRTALYANAEVSRQLREKFVLHWKSVRPVPIVTIDMGDGRILRRTITGNSIHYVLDNDGQVVDALPGLLGPKAFLDALSKAEWAIAYCFTLSGDASRPINNKALAMSHGNDARNLEQEWLLDALHAGIYGPSYQNVNKKDVNMEALLQQAFPEQYPAEPTLAQQGATPPASMHTPFRPEAHADNEPVLPYPRDQKTPAVRRTSAMRAATLAVSKGGGEKPLLRSILPPGADTSSTLGASPSGLAANASLTQRMNSVSWSKIAELHRADAMLDTSSCRLMISKLPVNQVSTAERASGSPELPTTTFGKTLVRFQHSMAEDTVRNQYLFHLQIHRWLADDETRTLAHDVEALNKKVYAELFLTPDDDPWLGLVPEDTYTALEKDGGMCEIGIPHK